tara:strand:- start:916 stop:2424 length:1509 start_codon:yes stop_codon:yes gene_type:complete
MSTPYIGNNTDGQFDPSYAPSGETKTPINVESVAMIVGGKQIAGYQSTYANGTSKWTAEVHTDSLLDNDRFDNSSFTGSYNESTEKWTWKPTTNNSIKNLANDWKGNGLDYERVTQEDIRTSFYTTKGANTNQKRFSNVQTEALTQEVGGLTNLKQNEKFSKLTGVLGTSTAGNGNSEQVGETQEGRLNFNSVNITKAITATKIRKTYGNYYYPQDIAANKQDRIIFTMKQSTGRVIDATNTTVNNFQRKSESIEGSVTLPITNGIKDLNSVDWKGSSMNPLEAFGAAAVMNLSEDAFNTGGKNLSRIASDSLGAGAEVLGKNKDVRAGINAYLAGQAVGVTDLLSRATGAIANPNMELLFNAPGLRAFDFTFQMSPRDSTEAAQIKSIINFFKQGMSVKTTSTNVFLKAPNYFNVDYVTFDEDGKMIKHPSIGIIKQCALLSCATNYTPNNSYMTYSDSSRSMVSYSMNLQFNELDPLYESDYYDTLDMQNSTSPSIRIGY